MKTLAWRDLGDPRKIFYIPKASKELNIFEPKRHQRNLKLLESIRHTGNIEVYLLKGNKTRLLFTKGI